MILGTGCLAEAALDGTVIRRALGRVGLDGVLLAAGGEARPASLAGVPAAGVRASWDDRGAGLEAARAAQATRLVLDLPASMEVEEACRSLHGLARSQPGLRLALLTPAEGDLCDPARLELVLDDLAGLPLGYWHRPTRAHLLGGSDVDWLDRLGRSLVGLSLDDVVEGEPGLPPGTGELDLGSVAELAARSIDVAVDTDPVPDVALLKVAVETLKGLGFP